MEKKVIRAKYKKLRFELSETERDTKSIEIANQLLKLPIWNLKTYHIFLPIEKLGEINTEYILNILYGKDKDIVLSKMDINSKSLRHFLLTEQTILKENSWGVVEPTNGQEVSPLKIDAVFVPLLGYDQKGNRVGYGGGYYDRFLQECPPKTLKIGLSFFPPETETILTESTDIPLDYGVSPTRIFDFRK